MKFVKSQEDAVNSSVVFSETIATDSKNVIVIVPVEEAVSFVEKKLLLFLDKNSVARILENHCDFSYNKIKCFNLLATNGKLVEIIIAGAGKRGTATRAGTEKLGGYIFDAIKSKDASICIFNDIESTLDLAATYLASGILLKSWRFDKYKTESEKSNIDSIECQTCYLEHNENSYSLVNSTLDGVFLTREMITEPANIMTPDQILEISLSLKKYGIKVSFLEQRELEKLGMNAIIGVGRGSDYPTYLITMEHCLDKAKDKIALVGKGLTFDSGGLCLKPSNRMGEMKGDMSGAAIVLGVMKSLALQKAKANVVGVIGVTENMISGKAQRPGDIVVSMSKKTIEIDNTDAEGRLVLADALSYTAERYAPKIMVDIATLTGAIQIALGHEFGGLFANDDCLASELEKSGKIVGEKLWRLPLHPSFEDDIKSSIADIKNTGSGRGAGSITAAMFLKEFVPKEIKWAHLDVAATCWDPKNRALSKKGATGFGVRLLVDYINRFNSANTREELAL